MCQPRDTYSRVGGEMEEVRRVKKKMGEVSLSLSLSLSKRKKKKELREVGSKLESTTSKHALLKLLKQAVTCLSEVDQSPSPSMLESMQPCLKAIAKPELLKHQDRDVKLLVATCICEITRITAPEAPYSDDVLRDFFHLIVGTLSGLADSNSPSFGRRVVILETLARYRSCVVMLDLECEDLVLEMFSTFFSVASDEHPDSVLTSMQTIMILLLEESEEIHENLLLILLSVLGRSRDGFSLAARRIAMNVIGHCAGKLELSIKQFLISSISGDNNALSRQLDYHEVIYDTYRCAPQILSEVIPYLTVELLADQLSNRLNAVKLLGDLFALPDPICEAFQPIFSEFLKRLTDRVVDVRISMVEHVKVCLLSNPFRREAPQIIASLSERLLDHDENVRKHVVTAFCDVVCCNLKSIGMEILRLVAERLRDKSLSVKRYTMERIAEIYRIYCLKCSDGSISTGEFEWIPGKIIRCFFDKDFRSETIEFVLCGSLFPMESTTKDRMNHWVTIFSGFDSVEVKALEKILEQKQRLQQEFQKYLSFRQIHKDSEATEISKRKLLSFRLLSRWFLDSAKAEKNFQILDQLKDANVWKIITNLLDHNTSFHQAWKLRDDLLQILGEKHPLYDFLDALSRKCSYVLFDKECVKEIFMEITTQKAAADIHFVQSCMNLLVILARFSPTLLSGNEGDLLCFLKEGNEILKEGALQILARAGGTMREQLDMSSSSVDLALERLCLEGSRKHAKYAVNALAAVTKDDGLKSLSVLYKRLVDMLADSTHLPAILQSLGCIAQIAMPIFETRESEIVMFISSNILERSNRAENSSKTSWNDKSELCLLKMYAMKTLVKSYLPVKDAHIRLGIDNFLAIIRNILSFGEVSSPIVSSPVDKAHMKLTAAKAVLRLSKEWDHKIPVDVFHLTLSTSETNYPEARKQFLGKVHQYIKDKLLDVKYACAFLRTIHEIQSSELEEYKANLVDVIQMCFQAKTRQHPMLCDANPQMTYPEYILPYLVHSVAHHSSCPDIHECTNLGAFETIYRQLHLFLSSLMHGNGDGMSNISNSEKKESISVIISIFQSIKRSEDTLDVIKSKNSHAVSELGLSITNGLYQNMVHLTALKSVSLPSQLYKTLEKTDGGNFVDYDKPSWLARDSVLAHLESLKLEPIGTVADKEEFTTDVDSDENNVPLGQIMKSFKLQGSKSKKNDKKKVLLAETENIERDFDILGMVREINMDEVGRAENVESSNGHGYTLCGDTDNQNGEDVVFVSGKRKKLKTGESMSLASSKQEHLSCTMDVQAELSSYQFNRKMEDAHVNLTDKISMAQVVEPAEGGFQVLDFANERLSSKHESEGSGCYLNYKINTSDEADDVDLKERVVDGNSDFEPSIKSTKKRKRRSITGLAKCSLKEANIQSLVGCRIKVWWPLDERFYEGLVQSYEPGIGKHEILYDDGDVEVLCLDKELWELITDGQTPRKQLSPVQVSLAKGMKEDRMSRSLEQKHKSNKKLEVTAKGMESKQSGSLEENMDTAEVLSRGDYDMKKCGTHVKDLQHYNEDLERAEVHKYKRVNDSEGNHHEKRLLVEESERDLEQPERDLDDEPLCAWKYRAMEQTGI